MSGVTSRRKGMTYENEVYNRLTSWCGQVAHLVDAVIAKQNRSGYDGDDLLLTIDGRSYELSIECKNQKEMKLASWVDQAVANAKQGQVPVVFHKRRGTMKIDAHYVTMRVEDFLKLLE